MKETNHIYIYIYNQWKQDLELGKDKIVKLLARLIKKKKKKKQERAQINKVRNEKDITINTIQIQKIIRDYYTSKMDNLEDGQTPRNILSPKIEPVKNRK